MRRTSHQWAGGKVHGLDIGLAATTAVTARVVESHVFSLSPELEFFFFLIAGVGVGFLKQLESELVFKNCWSRNWFFKTAGVGIGF